MPPLPHGSPPRRHWPALFRLRRTVPAYVSGPLRRGSLCPGTAGSWSLRPTRRPALRRPSGLWPPWGGPEHRGRHRAPDAPGETGPGRVAIATRPHHRRRTGAPGLLASGRPLCSACGPRRVARRFALEAPCAHARGGHHRVERSASLWRLATVPASAPVWPVWAGVPPGAPGRCRDGAVHRPHRGPRPRPDGASAQRRERRCGARSPVAPGPRPPRAAPRPPGWSAGAAVRSRRAGPSEPQRARGLSHTALR